jgi:hypothetical protein
MQKTVLVLITLVVLAGCGVFRPETTPTNVPRPTATPTKGLEYYPTVEPEVRGILIQMFDEYKKVIPYQEVNGEKSLVVWPIVSTGEFETIRVDDKPVELDVVWVIDYNHIKIPTKFPYVYGVWFKDEDQYFFFQNNAGSQPIQINRDEAKGTISDLLPRGIPFLVRLGTFVERDRVDWKNCNYPKLICDFGLYYSENIDFGVTSQFVTRAQQRIPNWWFLYGWLFDNLGTSIRLDLPGGEE